MHQINTFPLFLSTRSKKREHLGSKAPLLMRVRCACAVTSLLLRESN